MGFCHLRVHTDHSLRDSTLRVSDITNSEFAKEHKAIAVTDIHNTYAAIKLFEKARGSKMKPIIGADLFIDTEYGSDILPVICQTNTGYKNLLELITESQDTKEKAGQDPHIPLDRLIEKSEGLVVLSGGNNSKLCELLLTNSDAATEYANKLKTSFGRNFFIELQRYGAINEAEYIESATSMAARLQIPVVATNNVRFLKKEDYESHEIRTAIMLKQTLRSLRQSPAMYSPEQYMKTPAEMEELFADIPSAIANSEIIAKRCNMEIGLYNIDLPPFPVEEGHDEKSYLVKMAKQGFEERLVQLFPEKSVRDSKRGEYEDRLNVELEVINNMGFAGYFLIVMEFIQWSKANNIPVGPGRGSGAGSLVAYALKITDLDPLEYDLLFERFLNPERVSMPDFDIDFCQTNRDKVIAHVAELYGKEAVSQIITFGTMAAKSAVKDVCRVMGHSFHLGQRITKLIPETPGIKLRDAIQQVPALEILMQEDKDIREIMNHAMKLEGVTKQVGKHAGGVLISPTKISNYAGIYKEHKDAPPVAGHDKDDIEKAGLVKFDFLGLQTLSVVQMAVDLWNERNPDKMIKAEDFPLNDPETYKTIAKGNTTGVFQLESSGMKNLCQRLNPEHFEEIVALVALFRPGPLQAGMVDTFINCKKGIEKIVYPHPSLEQILDVTNGVFVYQEQVMQGAQIMAGYSLGQADLLRRAMGKKKIEEMIKQRDMFTEGAVKNGVSEHDAKVVFDQMETFAGYGFNKSHSAAYAVETVHTAYLKSHFKPEFYASIMSFDKDDLDKIVKYMHDAKENGVVILPPSINRSRTNYSVTNEGEVLYGLEGIKSVGEGIVKKIIEDREANGPYKNMMDVMIRTRPSITVLKALIYSGALDELGDSRNEMHTYYLHAHKAFGKYKDRIKAIEKKESEALQANQTGDLLQGNDKQDAYLEAMSEFEAIRANPDIDNASTDMELLKLERQYLGTYMSGHPNQYYQPEIKSTKSISISELTDISGEDILANEREDNGKNATTVTGAVIDKFVKNNKKGQTAEVTIDDGTGQVKFRLNNKLYNEIYHLVEKDEVLSITSISSFNPQSGRVWRKAIGVKDIEMVRQQNMHSLIINIDLSNEVKKNAMRELLSTTQKGTYKIGIRDTSKPDGEILPVGQGRNINDAFMKKVSLISDINEPYEMVFKDNSDSKKMGGGAIKFDKADEELVSMELKRAITAIREAQETLGLTL